MVHPVLRVNSVNRVPDARRRAGQIAPLSVRWAETVERIRTELPTNHPLQSGGNGMQSEIALDDLQDAFYAAKAALAPPPDNPAIREARLEFSQFQREFNSCCITIKNSQGWLTLAAANWRHQLLGSITPDMFTVPLKLDFSTEFGSVWEARKAVQAMLPRLQWVRGICAQISAAQAFERQSHEDQSFDLIRALVARKAEADSKIIALQSQCAALTARLDRLERRRNKKPKLQRAAA
jgi:hypothetical protein